MPPSQLSVENLSGYPPDAKRLAAKQLTLLQRLPLAFVPLLLRELIVYDWKFPAERNDLDRQFAWLASLSPAEFQTAMEAFARLRLSPELEQTDWVNKPAVFSEQLSAHLWATHQIDAFRAAAIDYVRKSNAAAPEDPMPTHRLGIAVIGRGVSDNQYRLFRKLRPQGVYFPNVKHEGGMRALLDAVSKRAESHPGPYRHWYIDGGAGTPVSSPAVTAVSWNALTPVRATLQGRMQKTYEGASWDPEAFRTMLAQTRPEDIGLTAASDGVLNRFQLSLFTEGSGTQVFSTTFVQWAAREALRRAQPLTMLIRFAPRQRERPMNELLSETQHRADVDPQGSLVDADMGAYYTWLNQQRLPGADRSAFLVWFEDHGEAVAIAPSMERGQTSEASVDLAVLVARLA